MEGLRGFAVFLVFLVHYVALILPWIPEGSAIATLAGALHEFGNTGVDLFFVLSGYLIYGSLMARPQPFARFMSRRIQRIYPAFTAVFVLYVILSFVFTAENRIPRPIFAGLLYLAENYLLLPGLFPIPPMITVAWSLSYEMFYYLALPVAMALFHLRDRSARWRVGFCAVTSVVTAVYCAGTNGPIRLIMFGAGIMLYEAIEGAVRPPGGVVGVVALVCGLLCTLLPIEGAAGSLLKYSLLCISFFVLCVACFREPTGWLATAFSWTPLRWLGNMSYSYYLLHGLTLKGASLVLTATLPSSSNAWWLFWALLPPMFALTLVPTALLFLGVERPFSLSPGGVVNRVTAGSTDVVPAAGA